MDDMEKSYLEIKVTFHHILILLVGVILIGSFLFYLGYQAGKTALTSQEQKLLLAKGESKTKEIESLAAIKKEPVKIEESGTGVGTGRTGNTEGTDTETAETPSIEDELKLHQQPTADTTSGTSSAPPAKTTETKTVSPKTEEPKVEEIKTAKPAKKSQYFAIQVGAFNSHALAKDYSGRFSRAGYAISISQAEVKGKTWYRVRVGSFETRDEAQKEKTKLEKLENKKFSVVKAE
jgi:cell division protein FtsN